MPLEKINLRPGVNSVATPTLADGTWAETNLVRWRDGYLEKIMGWERMSPDTYDGVCRSLHTIRDLTGVQYVVIGTNQRLEMLSDGKITDITPLRATHNVAVQFNTTIGSPTVKIKDVAHGAVTGDVVSVYVPVAVGGLVILGSYVITFVDADNYNITASANATANVVNGGAVPLYTTTNLSTTVKVTLANHGLAVGGIYTAQVSTTVATVAIYGDYVVDSVIDANNFNITALTAANASTTGSENGGNARLLYLIPTGLVSTQEVQGYGTGPYGSGSYGIGTGGTLQPLRYWHLDNWGVTLIAQVSQGSFYTWDAPLPNRAVVMTGTAPTINWASFITMPQQMIMSLGAEVLGVQDPLLIRWCDAGNFTDWVASTTNLAGSYRLTRGSRLMGGIQGPQAALIWTDADIWQATYAGYPFIWSINQIGSGSGLIAPLARAAIGREVYWMDTLGFWKYGSGVVDRVPCSVWDNVFQDIDLDNVDKCFAASNVHTDEVVFFYPSASGGTGEIDAYAKYNVKDNVWDYGPPGTILVRTAWTDTDVFQLPIGAEPSTHLIQMHEIGYDADGLAMTGVRAKTADMDLDPDGTFFQKVNQFIPDFKFLGNNPSVQITLGFRNYPQKANGEFYDGPKTIDSTVKFTSPSRRARQMNIEIKSDGLGSWWRLGASRVLQFPAGRIP